MDHGARRYILSPDYALRGWKYLPYATQALNRARTEFFLKEDWELFSACDGQTDIDWDSLSDEQKQKYESWERNFIIRRCSSDDEHLLPVQEYRFYPARFKEKVQWSITGRCNYKCKHCFMSAPHAAQGEPSWEQLMTMLDAFERCGIRNIELTGGEPMVRRDFWQLVDEILRRGLVVPQLYSNGLLVTDSFLDKLEERNMRPAFQFSFDGVGHHDWMRGIPGAEKIVLDAIERCKKRGFPVGIAMVVCRESIGSLRETVKLLGSMGVGYVKVGNATPQGEWLNQTEHFLSQKELYEAFLEYIPQYFEDGMPVTIGLEGFFNYDMPDRKLRAFNEKNIPEEYWSKVTMCAHVRRGMYVSPKGNVLSCMSMVGGPIEEKFPNMLETPLEDILDKSSVYMDIINFRISDYMEHNPECRTCKYAVACNGGCRALALQDYSDDYLAKDAYTCEYFKGGWMEKKNELLRKLGIMQ